MHAGAAAAFCGNLNLLHRLQQPPLLTVQLFTGGGPPRGNYGISFDAELSVLLWADGTLVFDNGSYPWCRALDPESLASVSDTLESLDEELGEVPNNFTELVQSGATVVWLRYKAPPASGAAVSRHIYWSPDLQNSDAIASSLDEVLCPIESVMGSGYRYLTAKHFSEFLSARGRGAVCQKLGSDGSHKGSGPTQAWRRTTLDVSGTTGVET